MSNQNIPIPSREAVISMQLDALLRVASSMAGILDPTPNVEPHQGGSIDGGVKASVETTLIKTCNRIDSILDRSTLWEMSDYDKLGNALNEIYVEHLALIKEQSASVRALDAPSRRYSPQLVRLQDGRWIAAVGPLTDLDSCIVGLGRTPEEAIIEFDNTFKGIATKNILEWAKACSLASKAGKPLPPHPSTIPIQNESPNQLDTSGTSPSPKTPSGRKNIRRNRKNPGAQSGSGEGEAGPSTVP